DEQFGGVLVDRLVDGHHHAHVEQRLHQVGALLGHAVGEFLDSDRFGDGDVTHLLFARLRLPAHVRAAFLFACALQRRKRPCAGALIVIECPRHGQLARAPAIVGTTSGCPLARILTLLLRPLRRFGTGDRGKPARRRCGSRFRSRCGFARRRSFGFGRLGGRFGLRLRRGRAGFGFLARTPVFLSAALFFFKGASALLRLTAGGFLGQAQTIFLGFALQAGDALLRRLARRRGLARRRRRRRRGRRSYRRGRRLRGRGR